MNSSMVALLVAAAGVVGMVGSAWVTARGSSKETASSAATKTLDKAYEQRLIFRDEKINELSNDYDMSIKQNEILTAEVRRLSALVVKHGGNPHEQ